jgi:phage terminase large subunit-like protein
MTPTPSDVSTRTAEPGQYFDAARAALAVECIERYLRHTTGEWAGQPFKLLDWQRQIVWDVYGWRNAGGLRRYREVFIALPRKNGKTTFIAAVSVLLFLFDDEPAGHVYAAAGNAEQATVVFSEARAMILASPDLARHVEPFKRQMWCPSKAASYQVLTKSGLTKHGLNPYATIKDELHTWKDKLLWEALRTGQGTRRQPIDISITTAGYDRKSLCFEQWTYARKVRDGVIQNSAFLPVLFEAAPEDDWRDPAIWARVNPSLGVTIKESFLAAECKRAQEQPGYENTFRQLYLNQWTEQASRWLSLALWDANAGEIDRAALRGRRCTAALDLAHVNDLSSLVLTFDPVEPGGVYDILPFFWVPEENIRARSRKDRVPYDVWAREGLIRATPGEVTDFDFIREDIFALLDEFQISEMAYDPWSAHLLVQQLMHEGVPMIEFRQGFRSMSPAALETERLLISRRLNHGGNPVLRWMASNVAVLKDPAGNIKPDKASSTERIDGIVALCMTIGRIAAGGAAGPRESALNDQDIVFLQ